MLQLERLETERTAGVLDFARGYLWHERPSERKSIESVASGCLAVAAGAQKPQCTRLYMRTSSTAQRDLEDFYSGGSRFRA